MSKFVIYVPLEKHLSQWITTTLGNPVTFPHYSNENAIIRAFTIKTPKDALPQIGNGTAIFIPDSAAKPPEQFNYIGPKGKKAIKEAIKDLFIRALWSDLSPLENTSVGLNYLIAAWCESKGIDLDSVEAVRQCYYRLRKSYAQKGINLKKTMKK